MAFTSTTDTRPHSLGDLVMLTGTFTNSTGGDNGGDILLASHLSKILAAGHNGNEVSAPLVTTEIDATVGTTITLVTGAGVDGTWWAIGNR